jgi:transcriptional regulator with XRE-family HTH domain
MTSDLSLVPPARLGDLLAAHRLTRGQSLDQLAASSGIAAERLAAAEAGDSPLADSDVIELLAAYGAPGSALVPTRIALVVDRDRRTLLVGRAARSYRRGAELDEVLARYLTLLEVVRRVGLQPSSPLRRLDVAVLADALEITLADVEQRLARLLLPGGRDGVERSLVGRLVVPAAGVTVGLTAVGILVFAPLPGGQRPTLVEVVPRPEEQSFGVVDAVIEGGQPAVPILAAGPGYWSIAGWAAGPGR